MCRIDASEAFGSCLQFRTAILLELLELAIRLLTADQSTHRSQIGTSKYKLREAKAVTSWYNQYNSIPRLSLARALFGNVRPVVLDCTNSWQVHG